MNTIPNTHALTSNVSENGIQTSYMYTPPAAALPPPTVINYPTVQNYRGLGAPALRRAIAAIANTCATC